MRNVTAYYNMYTVQFQSNRIKDSWVSEWDGCKLPLYVYTLALTTWVNAQGESTEN